MSTWVDPLNPTAAPVGEPDELTLPNRDLAAAEAGYVPPDVEADQDAIAEQVFAALTARVPGWQAHDANLDTWLVEAFAEVASEIRALSANVPASIIGTYGATVLGIPPNPPVAATGTANFAAIDAAGYTLELGTRFGLPRSGDDLVAFQTLQDAIIAPGSSSADGVPFVAVETGSDANGLTGAGQMLDPVTWVAPDGITVTSPTGGGQDGETPQDYMDRLSGLLRMVALRPVLPQDFAILALQNQPAVGRAVAMNLYNPADGTWTNERTVTLILTGPDGLPVAASTKQLVADQLEALREVNWVVNIIDATYDPVPVTFAAVAYVGQNVDTVTANVVANLTAYLDPSRFRLGELSPAISGGEVINPPTAGQPIRRQVIRLYDLVALIDNTLGVDYVQTVTVAGAAADYTLPDHYSLPTAGTITGTITGGTL